MEITASVSKGRQLPSKQRGGPQAEVICQLKQPPGQGGGTGQAGAPLSPSLALIVVTYLSSTNRAARRRHLRVARETQAVAARCGLQSILYVRRVPAQVGVSASRNRLFFLLVSLLARWRKGGSWESCWPRAEQRRPGPTRGPRLDFSTKWALAHE